MTSDYYCSQKFWWLSVDLEKRQTLSCCTATPDRIDIDWLKNNQNESMFNTPNLLYEREQMLSNKPVESCQEACWLPEKEGIISRRISTKSYQQTHTNTNAIPEVLNIIVGSHCNMACSYCCKTYSSSWYKDLKDNGSYNIDVEDNRFKITNQDRIVSKISQKNMAANDTTKFLIEKMGEMVNKNNNTECMITGGEPFLYNELEILIKKLNNAKKIIVFSGLGVNPTRFKKELDKIKHFPNLQITISAETINDNYEFVRQGNTWTRFLENLNYLRSCNLDFGFSSVVSNLTVFGLVDFYRYFGDIKTFYQACTVPDFLSIKVLDTESKELIKHQIKDMNPNVQNIIKDSIDAVPTPEQHQGLCKFMKEFTRRRNISADCFPKSFLSYVGL